MAVSLHGGQLTRGQLSVFVVRSVVNGGEASALPQPLVCFSNFRKHYFSNFLSHYILAISIYKPTMTAYLLHVS